MEKTTTKQYVTLLKTAIPETAAHDQRLLTKFIQHFPDLLSIKQMSAAERAMVLEWGTEMSSLLAGIELGRLVASSHPAVCGHAYSSAALGQTMVDHFREEEQECVAIAFTNIHNEIIDLTTLFRGGQSECLLYPDRIYSRALRLSASGLAMIHNHPSGDVRPSVQDLAFAKRLEQGAQILGLQMLDFLIVGNDRYFSWREDQQK